MPLKVLQEIIVPRCSGKTLRVNRGQIFRVLAHEGKQVADLTLSLIHI